MTLNSYPLSSKQTAKYVSKSMVIYFSDWMKTLEMQVKMVPSVGQDNGQVLVSW